MPAGKKISKREMYSMCNFFLEFEFLIAMVSPTYHMHVESGSLNVFKDFLRCQSCRLELVLWGVFDVCRLLEVYNYLSGSYKNDFQQIWSSLSQHFIARFTQSDFKQLHCEHVQLSLLAAFFFFNLTTFNSYLSGAWKRFLLFLSWSQEP